MLLTYFLLFIYILGTGLALGLKDVILKGINPLFWSLDINNYHNNWYEENCDTRSRLLVFFGGLMIRFAYLL